MPFNDILDWSGRQATWAQDAMRRLVEAIEHKLSNDSCAEIITRIKHANGIASDPAPVCDPLSANHLPKASKVDVLPLLCSIGDVKNVNRLAPDQTLSFALDGITLIYGDNGSGKSGYSRIAKKLCRALVVDDLLSDVFKTGNKAKAEALVRYKANQGQSVTAETWVDGSPPPAAIANIAVFDTKNARLYVDEDNKIQYLPPALNLMERYSSLLQTLGAIIDAEAAIVRARTSVALPVGFTTGSNVSEMIAPMVTATAKKGGKAVTLPDEKALTDLAAWDEKLDQELNALEKSLLEDPGVQSARFQRVADVVTSLSKEFEAAEVALSVSAAEELDAKVKKARAAKEAVAHAASKAFGDGFLGHTGSEAWKLMYEYARAYAVEATGKGQVQPTADDKCVLCQQPILPEAAARLKKFEDYIADKATKEEKEARALLVGAQDSLKLVKITSKTDAERQLPEYVGLDAERKALAEKTILFAEALKSRKEAMSAAAVNGDFSALPSLLESPAEALKKDAETLAAESARLKQEAEKGGDRTDDRKKLADLKDRKKLSQEITTFTARLKDLLLLENLKKCAESVNLRETSALITKLRKKLVTENLQTRVKAEIDNFALGHIPFAVHDRSDGGKSLMGVKLQAVTEARNGDVLSEGEQRALALACFLSEVLGDPVKHGIIIDDPVSSLDHIRIRKVAERLVREAAEGRQVAIFTHNLLFYSDVISAAAQMAGKPVPVKLHCIRKDEAQGFGLVHADEEPWIAKEVSKRAHILRNERLPALKGRTDTDTEEYRRAVKSFYSELRETWERFVEEVMLGGVVSRFNTDVKTQSLKKVSVENEDYRRIFWAMKRVSEHSGHDTAAGRATAMPSYDDMKKELDELDALQAEIKTRVKDVSKAREKLEEPPKAAVA